MSNKTSVISPAEGPPTHGSKDKRVEEEMANPGSTIAVNPDLAETREMAIKCINESEDMKNSGDGMRAIRRHGGTVLVIYMVSKGRISRKSGFCWLLRGLCTRVPDMTHLKRYGFFTVRHYHKGDWKSPSGRMSEEKIWFLKAVVPHSGGNHFLSS
jgi:hypothetical protein